MPLTFAHPALVLPLFRGPLVPAALVAGAMSPDVPYFLRATPVPVSAQSWYEPVFNGTTTHGWPGALVVAVPLALLLWLAWLLAVRPLRSVTGARGRADPVGPQAGPALLAWAAASSALGVLTHLVWDSFTHTDGFVAARVPALQGEVVGDLTWVRLLQHLSTVVGLAVTAAYLWRRRHRTALAEGSRRRTTVLLVVAAGVGVAGAAGSVASSWSDLRGVSARTAVEEVLSNAVTGGGVALLLLGVLAVAGWWAGHVLRRP